MEGAAIGVPFWQPGYVHQQWGQYDWEIEELARAEWGLDAADVPPLDLAMMTAAYMRRQEWIAERVAVNTINLLGELLTGKKSKKRKKQAGGQEDISASQFLALAGKEMVKR